VLYRSTAAQAKEPRFTSGPFPAPEVSESSRGLGELQATVRLSRIGPSDKRPEQPMGSSVAPASLSSPTSFPILVRSRRDHVLLMKHGM
jgi:hypothetical protein